VRCLQQPLTHLQHAQAFPCVKVPHACGVVVAACHRVCTPRVDCHTVEATCHAVVQHTLLHEMRSVCQARSIKGGSTIHGGDSEGFAAGITLVSEGKQCEVVI
jgi:hypothetical protein